MSTLDHHPTASGQATPASPGDPVPVVIVIPALNEAASIGRVLNALPREIPAAGNPQTPADAPHATVRRILVVDNGSTDDTARVATEHGADVVHEPQRGYGNACLAGLAKLADQPEAQDPRLIVAFVDADFSDDPSELPGLVQPILEDAADFVVGSRLTGHAERGSLTPVQQFGNWLACGLIRLIWRHRFTDLGPFRAIRYDTLRSLNMDDRTYGWTVQMQVRAVKQGWRCAERAVSYRKRIGRSKISGTLRGVVGAGTKILGTVAVEAWRGEPVT